MKRQLSYYLTGLLCIAAFIISGCRDRHDKVMNKRVTLWRNDKDPYGTWYAYEQLNYIFPEAKITINKKSPDRFRLFSTKSDKDDEDGDYEDKKSALIIITGRVLPDDNEVGAMLRMVSSGRQIFISAFQIGENLLDTFHLKTAYYNGAFNRDDSLTVNVLNPVDGNQQSYTYPGFSLKNYFTEMDTTITSVLGRDENGMANFVRIRYEGGGAIYMQVVPAAFTNFFLLHKQNKAYYDQALSYIPKNMEHVSWDDYFRYSVYGSGNPQKKTFSAFGWILSQPSLAMGLLLLVILALIISLVESKRKQRIIPPIPAVTNASLDFVKTVGRLYFQRKDNKNLAQKMTAFFMDHVRTRYNIRASLGDEDFAKRLSYKSGYDMEGTKALLYFMKYVQDDYEVNDESLLRLNQKLENFYAASAPSAPAKKQG